MIPPGISSLNGYGPSQYVKKPLARALDHNTLGRDVPLSNIYKVSLIAMTSLYYFHKKVIS